MMTPTAAAVRSLFAVAVVAVLLRPAHSQEFFANYTQCFSPDEIAGLGITPLPPSKRPTSIMIDTNLWNSHHVISEVARLLLVEAMGYTTDFVEHYGEEDALLHAATGIADINLEVWEDENVPAYRKYVVEDGTVTNLGYSGYEGMEGWYVTEASTTGNYSAKLYDFWRSFKTGDDVFADFPTYPTTSPDNYVEGQEPFVPPQCVNATCIEFWGDAAEVTSGFVEAQIVSLGLPVVVVYTGEELWYQVTEAIESSPAVFLWWQPSVLESTGAIKRVQFPASSIECISKNAGASDGSDGVDCDFLQKRLLKVAATRMYDDLTLVDALNFLRSVHMTRSQMNAVLDEVGPDEDVAATTAACHWLRNNTDVWRPWVFNHGVEAATPSSAAQTAFMTLASLSVVVTAALMAVMSKHRHHPVVKASSYQLMMVVGAGCLMSPAAVFLLAEPSEARCRAQDAIFSVSFTAAVSALVLKSWRVTRVFLSTKIQRSAVTSDRRVIAAVAAAVAVQGAVLLLGAFAGDSGHAVATTVDQSNSVLRAGDTAGGADVGRLGPAVQSTMCTDYSTGWAAVSLAIKGVLLLVGVFVAFVSRQLPRGFSEAKSVSVTIYSVAMGAVVTIPLIVSTHDVGVDFAARSSFILLFSSCTTLSVFGPRCYYVFAGMPSDYLETRIFKDSKQPRSGGASATRAPVGSFSRPAKSISVAPAPAPAPPARLGSTEHTTLQLPPIRGN